MNAQQSVKKSEFHLRKFSCVSKLWSKLIDEFVTEYFEDLIEFSRSNWLLLKFRNSKIDHLNLENRYDPIVMEKIYESTLRQLTNLQSVSLALNNDISPIGLELTALTRLDISDNTCITPACVEKLTTLKSLYLYDNKNIKSLSTLQKLPLLEDLRITVTSSILPALKRLTNLKTLFVESWDEKEEKAAANVLSDAISRLVSLHTLDLRRCHSCNCNGLRSLTNLTWLSIVQNNRVTNDDLSGLTNLTFLEIQSVNITSAGISSLTKLNELICWESPKILEDAFKNLSQLTCVWIHRGIKITQEAFRNLTKISDIFSRHASLSHKKEFAELKKIFPLLQRLEYPRVKGYRYLRARI